MTQSITSKSKKDFRSTSKLSLTPEERFWQKVEVDSSTGCWNWIGSLSSGYGQFRGHGTSACAHRFSFEMHKGPIPDGYVIDHECCNRKCVNPDHLRAVTPGRNCTLTAERGRSSRWRATQTHCKRGHELAGENVLVNGVGRACRECGRMHARAHYHKKNPTAGRRGPYKGTIIDGV